MREMLNKYRSLAVIVAVAVLLVAVWRVTSGGGPTYEPGQRWYYDVTRGELFAALDSGGSIDGPSGDVAYRAFVFSCSVCTQDQWFVAYIEKPGEIPEAPANDPTVVPGEMAPGPPQLALPPDEGNRPQWIAATNPQWRTLRNVAARCGGSEPKQCKPGD